MRARCSSGLQRVKCYGSRPSRRKSTRDRATVRRSGLRTKMQQKRSPAPTPWEVSNPENRRAQAAFTLLEIIIVITILSVLTAAAVPMVRNSVKRERESDLRLALRQLRQAIDRYKQYNDQTGGAAIPIEWKTPT